MDLRTVLAALGWLLIVASALVLGRSIFFESTIRSALEGAVPAGVLLALAGHLFTQSKTLTDAEEKRSSFNLQGFRQAFDHAHSLLVDANNQRSTWIEAARSLAHGEELAKAVTVDEHKRVLELERLKYRGLFSQFLDGRPAAFFYGVAPALYPSIDEAAKASTAREEKNGRIVVSSSHELDEASVRMVWLAASWPEGYNDPLGARFGAEELRPVMMQFPELHQFLEHKKAWSSAAGKLFPRQ
jgi:hypothetical protein